MGSALLRPQSLTVTVTRDDELVLALTDLAEAFARDAEASAAVVEIAIEELSQGLRDFVLTFEEPLRFADGSLRNLFAPYGDIVDGFTSGIDESAFASVPAFLGALRGGLTLLSSDQIVSLVEGLLTIAEESLGLTSRRLADLATGIAARIEERAMQPFSSGSDDAKAFAMYDLGSCIARLRLLLGELEMPVLDFDFLVSGVRARLHATDLDRIVELLGELLDAAEDVLGASTEIVRMLSELEVDASVSVSSPSVGAAAAADTEVSTGSSSTDPVAWYASWVAGETMRYPADTSLPQHTFENEWLAGFGYKHVAREKMETIARVTAWGEKALETFMHVLSIEQGDWLSNVGHSALSGIDLGLKAGGIKLHPAWYWVGLPLASVPLSLEGVRGGDAYWITNASGRWGEVILYRRWCWLLRETLLSVLTLINHDPEAFARFRREAEASVTTELGRDALRKAVARHNNNCIEGVAYLLAELGGLLLPGILSATDRENYGMYSSTAAATGLSPAPGFPTGGFLKALGGTAITSAFLYLSVFATRLMAGEWPTDWGRYGRLFLYERIFGRWRTDNAGWITASVARALLALVLYPVHQLLYLYLFTNGNTDGGQYGVDGRFNDIRYPGYPARTASPYVLPYVSGKTHQCVQGNLGIWSHFPRWRGGDATYAYDFSHDLGDEVLCSRQGIIAAASDSTLNGASPWNFVEILHLIVDPTGAVGAAPMPPPAGTTFFDGTAIPAGTLFPPYWSIPNFPLAPVPLHQTATAAAFPAGSTFSFIDPQVDRGVAGISLPAGATFSDGTPIPPGTVFAPGTTGSPATGSGFPAGTTFIPNPAGSTGFVPLLATFARYGHGQQNFLTTVFGSSAPGQICGRLAPVGRLIMIADSTGNSAYNHLHTDVHGAPAATGNWFTLPFVYSDVGHTISNGIWKGIFYPSDGRPRSMTYYTGTSTRVTAP